MESNNKNDWDFEYILGFYLGLLLVLVVPLCFALALGWRAGVLVLPFSHGAYIFLKFTEINNGRGNNKTN